MLASVPPLWALQWKTLQKFKTGTRRPRYLATNLVEHSTVTAGIGDGVCVEFHCVLLTSAGDAGTHHDLRAPWAAHHTASR